MKLANLPGSGKLVRREHATLMLLVLIVFLLTAPSGVDASDESHPASVEGTGAFFEITDSDYLNVRLSSTESVSVFMQSLEGIVLIHISCEGTATSTNLTLSGLVSGTTYYRYQEGSLQESFTADSSGSYSFTQDVTESHSLAITERESTLYITGDRTLTEDVAGPIVMNCSNCTLDGAGYKMTGNGQWGIGAWGRSNVTIKNLGISGTWMYTVYCWSCSNFSTDNLTVSPGQYYAIQSYYSSGSRHENNTVTDATYAAIHETICGSSGSTISGNTTSGGRYGIVLHDCDGALVTQNEMSGHFRGMRLYWAANNTIHHNNFLSSTDVHANIQSDQGGNVWTDGTEGNYWDDYTGVDTDEPPDGVGDTLVPHPSANGGNGYYQLDPDPLTDRVPIGNVAPVANAGVNLTIDTEDQPYTIIDGTGTDEDGDDLTYRWLEGTTVLLDWTAVVVGEADLDLNTLDDLSVGEHVFTLEVNDGTATHSDDMILTVENSAPHPGPTGAGVYELGADVTLGGWVSDYDGDYVTCTWLLGGDPLFDSDTVATLAGGDPVVIPDHVKSDFGVGIHIVTLRADDGTNPPVSADIEVKVEDTTNPTLAPEPSDTLLWPPNHVMVPILIVANADDNSGEVMLEASVSSNEPQDGLGDDDLTPDWTEPEINQTTGEISFDLRAERSGTGDGRVYTITITATDPSDNSSTATVDIRVPHDRRK